MRTKAIPILQFPWFGLVIAIAGCATSAPPEQFDNPGVSVVEEFQASEDRDGVLVWSLRADRVTLGPGLRASLESVDARFPRGVSALAAAALALGAFSGVPGTAGAGTPTAPAIAGSSTSPRSSGSPATAAPTEGPASADTNSSPPLEISANRLEVDHRGRTARFSGDVIAVRGEMTLRCDRIEARYDADGIVVRVEATGAVRMELGRLRASADAARYLEAERAVLLEGNLRITDGPSVVTGARARILIDEERFVVERARGTLVLGTRKTGPSVLPPRPAKVPAKGAGTAKPRPSSLSAHPKPITRPRVK